MLTRKQTVAFVVATILTTVFFLFISLEPRYMNQTWRQFQMALVTGDEAQAEILLTEEARQRINLSEWATLFEAEALFYSDLQFESALWPQDTRRASFSLFVADTEYRFWLTLRHEASEWRVHDLPKLHVSTAALLYPEAETMRLYLAENDFELTEPVYRKEEACLGFALCEDTTLLYWHEAETRFESRLARLTDEKIIGNDADYFVASEVTLYQQKSDRSYRVLTDFTPGMTNIRLCFWQGRVVGGLLDPGWMPDHPRILLHGEDSSTIYLQSLTIRNPAAIGLQEPGSEIWLPQHSDMLQIGCELGTTIVRDAYGTELARSIAEPLRFWGGTEALNLRFEGSSAERRVRGVLEVHPCEEGFYLINEIGMENYLRGVVGNEMPATFRAEALQIQAIVARGFALRAILHPGVWRSYGAHMDDSTWSQVYLLNGPENTVSDIAVAATEDEILLYDDQPAQPFFFSTSGGFTSAVENVWPSAFADRESRAYLRAMAQGYNLPLQLGEAAILDFYQRGDWQIPDRDSPWFRWQLHLGADELTALLTENLTRMARQGDVSLQTKDHNGFTIPKLPLEDDWFGDLRSLVSIQRATNGQIQILELQGSRSICRIYGELSIRRLFEPTTMVRPIYHLATGSKRSLELLPSTFVAWRMAPDGEIDFYGGGYGHGVGLSQYGVLGLLQNDWSVPRILQHYYPGTELVDWREWWR